MIRFPSHLQRSSHGIYYFRTAIPGALKPVLKRHEIKCSLRTRFKDEAFDRALPLSRSIKGFFGQVADPGMTYQEAKVLLERYLDDQLAAITRQLGKDGPLTFGKRWNLQQGLKTQRNLASFDLPSPGGRKVAERILKAEGMPADPQSKAFQDLAVWATKAYAAQIERVLARDAALATFASPGRGEAANEALAKDGARNSQAGIESDARFSRGVPEANTSLSPAPHHSDTMPTPRPNQPRTVESPALSRVLADYTAEKLREGSWTAKTKETARGKHDLLVRVLGDVPIRQIGTEQARDYKQVLQKLPANINTKPLYRSKTIGQILELKPDGGMAVLTVNNYLTWASSFFDWAERNGYVDRNPFRKLQLKNPKRAREARAAYTPEDLQKLFSTAQYRDHRFKHPHYYWLPLLGLHSGARLNELCQLHLKDIRQEDGVWVFDINEADPDKRVKTRSARRLVPIHPKLIELGLLSYVEEMRQKGETRLFPELKSMRDGAGQAASKWFARYRKLLGLYKHTPKKDFHSFRTTLINELKQKGHPEAQVAAVVGHASEGLTYGTYGKEYRPSVLITLLQDADFGPALAGVRSWETRTVR